MVYLLKPARWVSTLLLRAETFRMLPPMNIPLWTSKRNLILAAATDSETLSGHSENNLLPQRSNSGWKQARD